MYVDTAFDDSNLDGLEDYDVHQAEDADEYGHGPGTSDPSPSAGGDSGLQSPGPTLEEEPWWKWSHGQHHHGDKGENKGTSSEVGRTPDGR